MHERRQSKRFPSMLGAHVVIEAQSPIPCIVRDISATGAQIWIPDPIALPDEFLLDISRIGQSLSVQRAWSMGRNHGVMFLEELREHVIGERPERAAERCVTDAEAYLQEISGRSNADARDILDDARSRLAAAMGIPAGKIRLKLEIDP